jgi:RsiW-degrading membrane proteinase PrsW (M82 family)
MVTLLSIWIIGFLVFLGLFFYEHFECRFTFGEAVAALLIGAIAWPVALGVALGLVLSTVGTIQRRQR